MRTLAIECATEACSVALFDGETVLDSAHKVLGRGHAEQLVPMIAELPGKGEAGRIAVSLGPGSFTGVRIGVATARALGLAWQVPVFGYPTLALVAAMARRSHPGAVTVGMTGGHGEWFVQDFAADGLPEDKAHSLVPADAAARRNHAVIAGSKAEELTGPDGTALELLPDARRFLQLPGTLITSDLAPLYGRPPDARLPA